MSNLEQFQPTKTLIDALESQAADFDAETKELFESIKQNVQNNDLHALQQSVKLMTETLPQQEQAQAFLKAAEQITNIETEAALQLLMASVDLSDDQSGEDTPEQLAKNESRFNKKFKRAENNPLAAIGATAGTIGLARGIGKWLFGSKKEKQERKKRSRRQRAKNTVKHSLQNTAYAVALFFGIKGVKWLMDIKKEKDDLLNIPEKLYEGAKDKGNELLSKTGLVVENPEELTEKELLAQQFYTDVVTLQEDNTVALIGADGTKRVYRWNNLLKMIESQRAQELLNPKQYAQMQMMRTVSNIWTQQAKKVADNANALNSRKGEDMYINQAQKILLGSMSIFFGKIQTGKLNTPQETQTEWEKIYTGAQKLIDETEKKEGIIGRDSMKEVFSLMDGLQSYEDDSYKKTQLAIFEAMRRTYMASGNSQGVQQEMTTSLIENNEDYQGLDELLDKQTLLEELLSAADMQSVDSIASLLEQQTGLSSSLCKAIAKKLIKDYTSIQKTHTNNKQHFIAAIKDEYTIAGEKSELSKQRLLDAYNQAYSTNEKNYDIALRILTQENMENAINASFLQQVQYRCLFNILDEKSVKSDEEVLLSDIMGAGGGTLEWSDQTTIKVIDVGFDIAIALLPLGAGMAGARIATKGVMKLANATAKLRKGVKLGKAGKYVKGATMATAQGFGFYGAHTIAQNRIERNPLTDRLLDSKEIIKSIALMGIGNNIGKIFGKLGTIAAKNNMGPLLAKTPMHAKTLTKIVAEAGIYTGSMGAIDFGFNKFQGDGSETFAEQFTVEEFFMGLAMTAAFRYNRKDLAKHQVTVDKTPVGKLTLHVQKQLKKNDLIEKMTRREKELLRKSVFSRLTKGLSIMKEGTMSKFMGGTVTRISKPKPIGKGTINEFNVIYAPSKHITAKDLQSLTTGSSISNGNYIVTKTATGFDMKLTLTGITSKHPKDAILKNVNKEVPKTYSDPHVLMEDATRRSIEITGKAPSYFQSLNELIKLPLSKRFGKFWENKPIKDNNGVEWTVQPHGDKPPTFVSGKRTIDYSNTTEWNRLSTQLEGRLFQSMHTHWNRVVTEQALKNKVISEGVFNSMAPKTKALMKDYANRAGKKVKDLVVGDLINAHDKFCNEKSMKNILGLMLGNGSRSWDKGAGITKNLGKKALSMSTVNRTIALTQVGPHFASGELLQGSTDLLIRGLLARSIPAKIVAAIVGVDFDTTWIPFTSDEETTPPNEV